METICKECEGGGKIVKQVPGSWDWYFETCPACNGKGFTGQHKTPFAYLIIAFTIFVIIIFKCCG